MRCLEFSIFHQCANRCLFCSNSRRMKQFAGTPVSPGEIREVLKVKRKQGFGHVTFTGGEPTLYPRFWEVLAEAKEFGYRTQAISNGMAFSVPPFAERVLPYLDELCLSIHGGTAEVHDRMTGRKDSFSRIRETLKILGERSGEGFFLIVNMVVTRLNVDNLSETAEFATAQKRLRQFWVSSLIPEGDGLGNYKKLAAPFKSILKHAPRVREACRKIGAELRFFGFPPCVLGEYRQWASDLYRNPSVAVARALGAEGKPQLKDFAGGLENPKRIQTERCCGCSLAAKCPGVWERYHQEFGDAELEAVK